MCKTKFSFFLILVALFACSDENEFEYPLIQTGFVTDIDSTGATFHARIIDLGNSDILNYGFIWSNNSTHDYNHSENILISEPASARTISERISTTLDEGVIYYARAFIRNKDYICYGKQVAFTSLGSLAPVILAPVITDFFPKTGNIEDTLIIIGENFSSSLKNSFVYFYKFSEHTVIANKDRVFLKYQAIIIQASQDSLSVKVPSELFMEDTYLSVVVSGNQTFATEPFKLNKPVIDDFYPKSGTFGSIIEITGNFISDKNRLIVKFGEINAEIISSSENLLRVRVPEELTVGECRIKVVMNNLTAVSMEVFKVELP